MTLRDAVVDAGLATQRAANWRAFVIRQTDDGPSTKHVNIHKIINRGHLDHNIFLESGDIVYVPLTLLDKLVLFVGRITGPLVGLADRIIFF